MNGTYLMKSRSKIPALVAFLLFSPFSGIFIKLLRNQKEIGYMYNNVNPVLSSLMVVLLAIGENQITLGFQINVQGRRNIGRREEMSS